MAPFEVDPNVEAKMAKIDALLARDRAIVESWGYKVHVPSAEEVEAELKLLSRKEPPGLGLGYPIPQDWIDGEEERNAAEDRKWKAGSLRKNMGLQASKPRNAVDKHTSANNGAESSDEEEGRSGLGKAKRVKVVSESKIDVGENLDVKEEENFVSTLVEEPIEFEESTVVDEPEPGSLRELKAKWNKVQAWNEETAQALDDSPSDPADDAPTWDSYDQDFLEQPTVENHVSEQSIFRSSAGVIFEKPQNFKKRKHTDSIDTSIDEDPSTEKQNKPYEITHSIEFALGTKSKKKRKARRSSNSEPKHQSSELSSLDEPTTISIDKEYKTEEGIIQKPQTQAEIDAKAKARQLARERLGSGSTLKKTKEKIKISANFKMVKKHGRK